MKPSIKVSEENHKRLTGLMLPRESFDDVITRLVNFYIEKLPKRSKPFGLGNIPERVTHKGG